MWLLLKLTNSLLHQFCAYDFFNRSCIIASPVFVVLCFNHLIIMLMIVFLVRNV